MPNANCHQVILFYKIWFSHAGSERVKFYMELLIRELGAFVETENAKISRTQPSDSILNENVVNK